MTDKNNDKPFDNPYTSEYKIRLREYEEYLNKLLEEQGND